MSGDVLDEKRLGKRLQAARQSAGLTQEGMCREASLSYSTLAKIERGAIKSPSVFTVKRIADVLGVTLDELMGGISSLKKTKLTSNGASFIYFDINGCLVRFYERAFNLIAKDTGRDQDMVETVFLKHSNDIWSGEVSVDEFSANLAKGLGVENLDWQDYYLDAIEPITEMHDLVREASKEYRVGLLSNIEPGFVGTMIQKNFLPNIAYDAIVDSASVGVLKPSPKIYEIAEAMAGVSGGEILFIDDNQTNLIAAQESSWNIMRFDYHDIDGSVERVRATLRLV